MKTPLSLLALMCPTLAFAQTQIHSSLGKGVLLNDASAGMKDECVQFDSRRVVQEDIRSTQYRLLHVKTKEELSDKINMGGSAQAGYGTFSGDLKARFIKEIEWNQNSNYILIQASRVTIRQSVSYERTELKSPSLKLLMDSKFKFMMNCGNAFVTSVDLGGEIFGLIEIKSDSYSEKQQIESSLKAAGSFFGGSVSGKSDYERTIRKLMTSYKAKIEFRHIGGDQVSIPQTPDELIELSSRIESLSDHHPVALSVNTRDYGTVSNYVIDPKGPDVQIRQNTLDALNAKLNEARNQYSKILYILEFSRSFKRVDEEALKDRLSVLDGKIIELKNQVAKCSSFVNPCELDDVKFDSNFTLPEMKASAEKRGLKIQCVVKASPVCGVKQYREEKTSACGVVAPVLGSGPVCGTLFKFQASERCGVNQYKMGAGPECGVKQYNTCLINGTSKGWGKGRKKGRHPSCGVSEYNSCRHPSFGVESYNECRDSMHGVEKYETCRHKDFGYEFESCRHFSHGPDTYQSCEVAEIGGIEFSCPKF